MANTSDYRAGRHCVFNLHVHLVFVAKYRRLVFTQAIVEDLRTIFSDVCQDFEASLEEFDGERDHGHRLVTYPPKVAISQQGVSSRLIRAKSTIPSSSGRCGAAASGPRVILRGRLVRFHSRLFASILKSNKFRIDPCRGSA